MRAVGMASSAQARLGKRAPTVEVPGGAPQWVTAELLQEAIEVWQPYYDHELTVEDALEITLSVGRLADVISMEDAA
jgi:hypothetical protein